MYVGIHVKDGNQPFNISEIGVFCVGWINGLAFKSFGALDATMADESCLSDLTASNTANNSSGKYFVAWINNDTPDSVKKLYVLSLKSNDNALPVPADFDVVYADCAIDDNVADVIAKIVVVDNIKTDTSWGGGYKFDVALTTAISLPRDVVVKLPAPAPTATPEPTPAPTPIPELIPTHQFRAVVTMANSGEIVRVDGNAKTIEFFGEQTHTFIADVTIDNKNNIVGIEKISGNGNGGWQSLLNIQQISATQTTDDKTRISAIKKQVKIGANIPVTDKLLVCLKSNAIADLVLNKIQPMVGVDNDNIYRTIRLLGIDHATAEQICTIFGVFSNSRAYLTEEQLQIAGSDISMLVKAVAFLKLKNTPMPSLATYIDTLRSDQAVMSVIADAGLKYKVQ